MLLISQKNKETENWQLDLAMDFIGEFGKCEFSGVVYMKAWWSGFEEEREKKIDTSD